MAENSTTAPHIRQGNAPLNVLIKRAIVRHGDFNPEVVGGEIDMAMLEWANLIIDDVRAHPYWSGPLDYYTHPSEARDVPDNVIVAGLVAKYADQQGDENAGRRHAQYLHTLNQLLYYRIYGNRQHEIRPRDGGSRPDAAGSDDVWSI